MTTDDKKSLIKSWVLYLLCMSIPAFILYVGFQKTAIVLGLLITVMGWRKPSASANIRWRGQGPDDEWLPDLVQGPDDDDQMDHGTYLHPDDWMDHGTYLHSDGHIDNMYSADATPI